MRTKKRPLLVLLVAIVAGPPRQAADIWRAATPGELRQIIPARAQVEKERIETEFRTASGITNEDGKFIAGVVLITAGYAAEGKYSNFLVVQVPIKVEQVLLPPGNYLFGWKHSSADTLLVTFYDAESGKPVGSATAERVSRTGRIESFRIRPPRLKARIEIGRFAIPYAFE